MKTLKLSGAFYPWNSSIIALRDAFENSPEEDLKIDINSPGGAVTLGIEMYNRAIRHKGRIEMNVIGQAASMATYFALAGDKLTVQDNSIFMIHNAWGVAVGDYRDARKMSDVLDAMTGIMAAKYAEKTGKALADIRADMDEEKYLFGEDIKKYGFADEVIKTGRDKDKKKTKAKAMVDIQACLAELKEHPYTTTEISEIAAYAGNIIKAPVEIKGKKTEVKKMPTLKEVMAENPGVKAEVEALVMDAEKRGQQSGVDAMQSRIDAASPYVGKTEYPEAIAALAVGVLKGEKKPEALEGAVVAFDAIKQQTENANAQDETDQTGETPPQQPDGVAIAEDGSVSSEAEYQASLKAVKGGA